MSRRISLSIPDALHRQLEEWRDSFNLSRIFQDALAELIKRKESVKGKVTPDLPEVIARLKQEKEAAEGGWFERGVEAGLEWAKSAHWLELRTTINEKRENLLSTGGSLSSYLTSLLRAEERKAALSREIEEFRAAFLDGWFRGVRDFWCLVNEQLREN